MISKKQKRSIIKNLKNLDKNDLTYLCQKFKLCPSLNKFVYSKTDIINFIATKCNNNLMLNQQIKYHTAKLARNLVFNKRNIKSPLKCSKRKRRDPRGPYEDDSPVINNAAANNEILEKSLLLSELSMKNSRPSSCNTLKGFITPNVTKHGIINEGCPPFMKRDEMTRCCIFDMKHIRNKLGMKQKMDELLTMISQDKTLDNEEKNGLYVYLRTGDNQFDLDMSIELKNQNRGVMNWLVDMVKSFFSNIVNMASAMGSAVMLFFNDILASMISITNKGSSELDKEKSHNFLSRVASVGAGAVAGGTAAALSGGGLTSILTATAVGGAVGYIGPFRILSMAYNFAKEYLLPLYETIEYVVRKFTADIHIITATFKVFLGIKRSLCSNLGVLIKNRQLMLDYLAKKNILSVSSLVVDDAIDEAKEATVVALIRHKSGDLAQTVVEGTVEIGGSIVQSKVATNLTEPIKQVSNIAGQAAKDAIDLTLLKNSISDTYQYVMMIFDLEDCEMHYTNRKMDLFESILRKEVSDFLDELIKKKELSITLKLKDELEKTEAQKKKEQEEREQYKKQVAKSTTAAGVGTFLGGLVGYGAAATTGGAVVTNTALALGASATVAAAAPVVVGALAVGALFGILTYANTGKAGEIAWGGDKVETVAERKERYFNESKEKLDVMQKKLNSKMNDFYKNNEYHDYRWKDDSDNNKSSPKHEFFRKMHKVDVTMDLLQTFKGLNYEWTAIEKLGIKKLDENIEMESDFKELSQGQINGLKKQSLSREQIQLLRERIVNYKHIKEQAEQYKKAAIEKGLYDDRLDTHAKSVYGNEKSVSEGVWTLLGYKDN